MNDTKRKLAAIVFTDIAGFTKLSSNNEPAALALLEKQRELLQPVVEKSNGEWLKEIGDGLLLAFGTTRDAVDCAIEIQHITKDVENLDLRIGIHQGEVVFQGNDVVGDDVNIASRIEPFAATGGIAISGGVNSSLDRDPDFKTEYLGTPDLKGVNQEVKVYCIVSHNLPKTDANEVQAKIEKKGFQWNLLSMSGAALTLVGLLFWINLSFLGIGIADTNEVLSLAVLPFENKGDKKDEFYAYGISSDLIKDVSSAGMLRVAGLGDIEKLEYSKMNYNELADKLRVRYVAKGTLWKMDSVFQLSMELFDTKNSEVVWSNRWQTGWSNLATIKGDLSNEILANLNIMVTKNAEQVNVTGNPEAYEYYLKGNYKVKKRTTLEDIEISRGMFEKAMDLDSNLVDAVNSLAATFSLTSDFDKAEELYKKALKVSLRLNDKDAQTRALSGLGLLEYYRGNLDDALETLTEVKILAEKTGSKERLSTNLNNLAIIYSTRGNNEKALEMLYEMRDIEESLDNKSGLQYAYNNLSAVYSQIGKPELSYENVLKAYELAKEIEDLDFQATALTNIAVHELNFNKNYDKSLKGLDEVLEIYTKLGKKQDQVETMHRMVAPQAALDKSAELLETSEKALRLSEEIKNEFLIAKSYIYSATVHKELGDKPQQLINLKKSRKIIKRINNQDMLGEVLGRFSDYFKQIGNMDSSMYYATNALNIHESLGNKPLIAIDIYRIGQLHLVGGNTELALEYADNALGIANETSNERVFYSILPLKWSIYFQQKNYAKAMDDNVSEWYNWFINSKMHIPLDAMSTYLVCLKKLNRDYDLSRLETLMKETPERKYGYVTNYRLFQLYEKNTYLKNAYDEIMDLKSNLDKKTGKKFISYPLESEIIEAYQSIS